MDIMRVSFWQQARPKMFWLAGVALFSLAHGLLGGSALAETAVAPDLKPAVEPALDKAAVPPPPPRMGKPAGGCQGVAGSCVAVPRAEDQIWVVSARCLSCGDYDGQFEHLKVWKYEKAGGWVPSNVANFYASDDGAAATSIFVHGNRIAHCEAFSNGWQVYTSLARCAPMARPIRFVIWSWPSDKIDGGQREDVQVKAERTAPAAHYLARFVDRISPDVPVSLIGYSFGSRIITGSLHLLGGGTICSQALATRVHPQRTAGIRAVLMASALDCDWLLPGHAHGLALSQVDFALLVNNECDRALRFYPRMYGRGGPSALGYEGLATNCLSAGDQPKVAQMDACCYVGKQHDWTLHFGSSAITARIRPYAFFIDE